MGKVRTRKNGLEPRLIAVSRKFDLPAPVGVIGGAVSLIGGHGTTIAWEPSIAKNYNMPNAMEIGIASATFGLNLASLMGGPVAKFLITRHRLEPAPQAAEAVQDVGLPDEQAKTGIGHLDFLGAVLAIHVCIIVGYFLNESIAELAPLRPARARRLVRSEYRPVAVSSCERGRSHPFVAPVR